ncbi:MAG: YtxH domain-containing protein [Tissierellia bacterium]|nr:YtxH domain-containing protein [Tissierellia bacterium]
MSDMKKAAKPLVKGLGLKHLFHHNFWGGAAVGALAVGFLRTKKARELAVKGLATGMSLKDDAKAGFATLKEEAEQLHEEAKRQVEEDRKAEECEDVEDSACCPMEEE